MKPNCDKHKDRVVKYDGTLEELATDLGDLRYDTLSDLMALLSDKILADGVKDYVGGRPVLSGHLERTAMSLLTVKTHVDNAWDISKPFMNTKTKKDV